MEKHIQRQIEESKNKAERILEDKASEHTISKRWIVTGHPEAYLFCFSIDYGKEQKMCFSYTDMTDGEIQNNARYIEKCIEEKLKSMGI